MIKDLTEATIELKKYIDFKTFKQHGAGVLISDKSEDYYFMFKREYYRNFNKHFPEVKKDDGKSYGWAQIMSKRLLNEVIALDIPWILFMDTEGKVYRIASKLWRNFVQMYDTEVPHIEGEVAIPLDFFERMTRIK